MTSMCRSGCPTPGEHESYGACARAASVRIAYANSANGWDLSKQKRMDRDQEAYRDAVAQGLRPEAPTLAHVRVAEAKAEAEGK